MIDSVYEVLWDTLVVYVVIRAATMYAFLVLTSGVVVLSIMFQLFKDYGCSEWGIGVALLTVLVLAMFCARSVVMYHDVPSDAKIRLAIGVVAGTIMMLTLGVTEAMALLISPDLCTGMTKSTVDATLIGLLASACIAPATLGQLGIC